MATWTKRKKLWKQNKGVGEVTCCFCETILTKRNFTIEHVIPQCFCKGKPWKNSFENTKTACVQCNHRQGLELDSSIKEYGKEEIYKKYQAEIAAMDLIYKERKNLEKLMFNLLKLRYKRKFS